MTARARTAKAAVPEPAPERQTEPVAADGFLWLVEVAGETVTFGKPNDVHVLVISREDWRRFNRAERLRVFIQSVEAT